MLLCEDSCDNILVEFLKQRSRDRSPSLERSTLNRDTGDTPPPLIDIDTTSTDGEDGPSPADNIPRPLASAFPTDHILIKQLSANYINTNSRTDRSSWFSTSRSRSGGDSPKEPSETVLADDNDHMIAVPNFTGASMSRSNALPRPASARKALLPLHEIMDHTYSNGRPSSQGSQQSVSTSGHSRVLHVSRLSINSDVDNTLNVRSIPKLMLPSIQSTLPTSPQYTTTPENARQSPTMAKFAIGPVDTHPSQTLPRMQGRSSPTHSQSPSPELKQTLPSIRTALSSVTDSNGTPWPEGGLSSTHSHVASPPVFTPAAPSPSYIQTSPALVMSPPKTLPVNLPFWRTSSQNSSNSDTSDYHSNYLHTNISTPASSVPGHSPAARYDAETGLEIHPPFDPRSDSDEMAMNGLQIPLNGIGYRCTWPGCTAPPFQTQYLLNSHTNVHSNTRPHFCPVEGCARGPGGQGFKRKNEMIRHGLVHQSPGYVCPFCPDQQHKYPRPDNLQRHVKVHHVERDRDDPQLRDVLAQRPEGGNRGRRRRLGS